MNRTMKWIAACLVLLLVLEFQGQASADWYNPFSWNGGDSKSSSRKPGTLSKLNNGTKKFFYDTADFLNPFNDGDEKPKTRSPRPQRWSKKDDDGWGWGSWFVEEEPGPPATVTEFLDMERAKF